MRARGKLVAAALALPLLTGVAACGEMQEAQQGLQQAKENVNEAQQRLSAAQACAKAMKLAQFTPDFSNPQQAQQEARTKAEKLGKLAEQTSNNDLQQNLRQVQDSVERVANGEVTAQNSAQWIQQKLTRTQKIISTCQGMTG